MYQKQTPTLQMPDINGSYVLNSIQNNNEGVSDAEAVDVSEKIKKCENNFSETPNGVSVL